MGLAAMLLFAIVVTKDAWLSDDAFITLRTVDNFWHGYGLRWNVIERVQTYTHPLWMLLLGAAYGVTREPHVTTLVASLVLTGAVAWLLFRRLSFAGRAFALVTLAGSRAFVDYSTSGLENPLSHLLLAAFWLIVLDADTSSPSNVSNPLPNPSPWSQGEGLNFSSGRPGLQSKSRSPSAARRRLLTLGTLASLSMLSRLDLVLLTAPGVGVEIWRSRSRGVLGTRQIVGILALASVPLILWHLFSLIYYGFVFPNTAYAKLGTGLSSSELMAQGLRYLRDSFRNDALTLVAIAAAVGVGLWRRTAATTALAFAIAAYVGYIVRAGGDFMSGRFLTAPFLCAVILLARQLPLSGTRRRLVAPIAVIAAVIVSLAMPESPLRFRRPFDVAEDIREADGIVDERQVHSPSMGFMPTVRGSRYTNHMWAQQRFGVPRVWIVGAIGVVGFTAGPGYHGLDPLALADPLLARLSVPPGSPWRIGHFERKLPEGYEETLQRCVQHLFPSGAIRPPMGNCFTAWDEINRFRDPALGQAYRELLLITQGPLFDRARLQAIVRWNLGRGPLGAARGRGEG